MLNYIAYTLISVGVAFNVVASISLIRFPDIYARLQASAKTITLGTVLILAGVFVACGFTATGVKALFAALFLFLVSPLEAHALARAARRQINDVVVPPQEELP